MALRKDATPRALSREASVRTPPSVNFRAPQKFTEQDAVEGVLRAGHRNRGSNGMERLLRGRRHSGGTTVGHSLAKKGHKRQSTGAVRFLSNR